ncbi:MAG: hypothetical protein C0471_16445 [Erythrobacter sp.]|nr:hypothetical protein [Erythrobacter sp.]
MDGFLLALLLTFALAFGGRDQVLVAQWSDALGQRMSVLVIALICAGVSAGVMAWLGSGFAALLPRRAGQMLVAFALFAAAIELAWPAKPQAPREPTRSLGAIAIVLLARQIGDGARFTVFALAAWAHWPAATALGGAIGGSGAVALGWTLGAARLSHWPLRTIRLALAACLIVAALFTGLNARFAAF